MQRATLRYVFVIASMHVSYSLQADDQALQLKSGEQVVANDQHNGQAKESKTGDLTKQDIEAVVQAYFKVKNGKQDNREPQKAATLLFSGATQEDHARILQQVYDAAVEQGDIISVIERGFYNKALEKLKKYEENVQKNQQAQAVYEARHKQSEERIALHQKKALRVDTALLLGGITGLAVGCLVTGLVARRT